MIDIVFAILVIIAAIKGYRKGLIVALFSVLAFIIGLAAALKLSATVAIYLEKNVSVPSQWLPVLSFALVFIAVAVLINWGGKLIEQTFQMVLLGWANKIVGMTLYIILYLLIYSVVLFYAAKIHLISNLAIQQSATYAFVQPWGPVVLDGFGKLIPWFKDSFADLEEFFAGVSSKITP